MKTIALATVGALLALASCVDEYDDDLAEDGLGEAAQGLSDITLQGFGPGTHAVAPLDHICFVAGVRGRMIGTGFELYRGTLGWSLAVGDGIKAVFVACHGPVLGRPAPIYEWSAGDSPTSLGPYRSTSRCFLSGYGTLGAMNDPSDNVRVFYSSLFGEGFLGGGGDDDTAKANAICTGIAAVVSVTTVQAPEGGSVAQQVATAADNAICGLSMIGGNWTQDPLKINAARLYMNDTGWYVSADDGRKVTAVCVR